MTASFDSNVDVTVRFAYGQDIYDTTPTWTDETSDVMSFSITRGRSRVLDQVQPGVATIRLLNTSGDYSPWNTQGANSPNVDVLTRVNIRAVHNAITYDIYDGYVMTWPNKWNMSGKLPVVEIQAVDGFHLLQMVELEITRGEEKSGSRIGQLLGLAGWPTGGSFRNVDTGIHNVAALSEEFNSVLGEIFRTTQVEDGMFYIDGAGVAQFRDGVTRIEDDTLQATFSDDGAGVSYRSISVDYDTTQVWNNVTITRDGGTEQLATSGSSISAFGQRDLHVSNTVHVADGEALALADWYAAEFANVRARVPEVTLRPQEDPSTLWPQALGLDFWEKVNVEVTTVVGDDFDENCYVEGVSHNVTMVGGRMWETTFQLSPDLPFTDWWILGTSELGTDTRLAY